MQLEHKLDLITKHLHSVSEFDKIRAIVAERQLHIYWGVAPVGEVGLECLFSISKIADFLEAGCRVTILVADMHARLNKMLIMERTQHFEKCIRAMLKTAGILPYNLHFVRGSEFQLSPRYIQDVFQMSAEISLRDARAAGAALHKSQSQDPSLASAIYPLMQALDEHYVGADAQFGNYTQRSIFEFAERCLPRMCWLSNVHLLSERTPMFRRPIEILDSPHTITEKLRDVSTNGLLDICRLILLPLNGMINISDKKNTTFESFDYLKRFVQRGKVNILSLRKSVAKDLGNLLAKIQDLIIR